MRHSKALPVMRPENTSGANGRDARYGGARAGAWANCKWRWALASRNGEKRKQNRRRFLYEVCRKTYMTGKGSEGKLATQRSRNPIYFFHLRRDMAGQGLHSITCDIREKARTRKAFRRPQTVAFLAAAERQPTSKRDKALSRQISLFPSFIAQRRVKETLCIIRLGPRAGGSEETVWE